LPEPIVETALKIDIGAASCRDRRGGSDRTRPRAGIQADQNEAREMGERSFAGLNGLPLEPPTGRSLDLSVPSADVNEPGSFCSREPSVTRPALLRQGHLNQAAVIAFRGMVTDGGSKIFQVASRPAFVATIANICAALLASDFGERLFAPPIVQSADPHLEFADIRYRIFARFIDLEAVAQSRKLGIEIDQ
jgi:hypothetical protein